MQIVRGKKLKLIFSDHWLFIAKKYRELPKRPAIAKTITKMLACGTEAMGYRFYQCPKCGYDETAQAGADSGQSRS